MPHLILGYQNLSEEVKLSKKQNNFIPNSFQITNNIVDEVMPLISGNALKCYLLIIRKTRGCQKEKDSISISQFIKHTGIKRGETITKSINELLYFGLISNVRIKGKITKYLPSNYNGLTVAPLKNSTTKKPCIPPLKNRVTSTPKKPCTTKDTIKTTILKDNKSKPNTKRFVKPTAKEINNYQLGYKGKIIIDAEQFIDSYESKGWMIGKNKMKDWQASVRTWIRNTDKFTGNNKPIQQSFKENNYETKGMSCLT